MGKSHSEHSVVKKEDFIDWAKATAEMLADGFSDSDKHEILQRLEALHQQGPAQFEHTLNNQFEDKSMMRKIVVVTHSVRDDLEITLESHELRMQFTEEKLDKQWLEDNKARIEGFLTYTIAQKQMKGLCD